MGGIMFRIFFVSMVIGISMLFESTNIMAQSSSDPSKKNTANDVIAVLDTNYGTITVKLYHKRAPITVSNFVELARKGFYNNLSFHRIVPGFVIQGGDPQGSGVGGPGYQFDDEFHPELKHTRKGILSMANAGPGTNGSQFFITLSATPHLDGRHSVFGEVLQGLDVLDAIAGVKVDSSSKPQTAVTMKSVKITGEFEPVQFKKYMRKSEADVKKYTEKVARFVFDSLAAQSANDAITYVPLGKLQDVRLTQFTSQRDEVVAIYVAKGEKYDLQIYIKGHVKADDKNAFVLHTVNTSYQKPQK